MFQGKWETKEPVTRQAIQAKAIYQGEKVEVIDSVGSQLLIIYDGPKWVDVKDLNNITWMVG